MPKVDFKPKTHGFHFANAFANRVVRLPGFGDITTYGRCGGMAYAALDYFFHGLPIPAYRSADFGPAGVPQDGTWLADYIYGRLIQSFLTPSALKFISLTLHSDHPTWLFSGLTRWTRRDEFPKLQKAIDSGKPVVLGLLARGGLDRLGDHHQVIAYGYEARDDGHLTVYIYDNNSPDEEVTLTSGPEERHFTASNGAVWRGFFLQDYAPSRPPLEHYRRVVSQGSLSLPPGEAFSFAFTDWNRDGSQDLLAIRHADGSSAALLQVLSGASHLQRTLARLPLPLPAADDFTFTLAHREAGARPDLVAVRTRGTSSGSPEVCLLSGESEFQQVLLQRPLPLPSGDFAYAMGDCEGDGRVDLLAVRRRGTDSGRAELFVLSGASEYQRVLLHRPLPLPAAGDDFVFAVTDWDRDGRADLVALRRRNTSAGRVEVHVLSAASDYQQHLLRTSTALPEGDGRVDFTLTHWDQDGRSDVVALERRGGPGTLHLDVLPSGQVEPLD